MKRFINEVALYLSLFTIVLIGAFLGVVASAIILNLIF